jgi:hypothetical protein
MSRRPVSLLAWVSLSFPLVIHFPHSVEANWHGGWNETQDPECQSSSPGSATSS